MVAARNRIRERGERRDETAPTVGAPLRLLVIGSGARRHGVEGRGRRGDEVRVVDGAWKRLPSVLRDTPGCVQLAGDMLEMTFADA